ncbi:hypothetical protein CNMCM5793_004891 [Aspergillus hiratsukae]|uniref:Uncharacterized protein n=1 Tax=Aspergillus hiratsukae TaxID=1194566 RepID=A0A8H6U9G7_9EURO|nr:hypothetical protein CNMCM5793_004891 [Aspergillus hiratsukae]
MTNDTRRFKVLLVGNSGVGKTAFLHRYVNKRFEHSLPPTMSRIFTAGVKKYDVLLNTTAGPVRYKVSDVSGFERPNGLLEEEWDKFDAAIIMFDLTDRKSYNNVPNWYQGLVDKDGMRHGKRHGKFIPICICGNKDDAPIDVKLPPKLITFPKKKLTGYVEMSVMSLSNIHEPFLDLARQLLDIPHLEYKSLPDVGSAAFECRTGSDRPQQNGSRDHEHAIEPRVETEEMPSPEPQIGTIAGTSEENFPAVTEPPKRADASDGRLKFVSTTNRPQTEVNPPATTADISAENSTTVNQSPKEADASNGRLKFLSTTNKPQTEVNLPAATADISAENSPTLTEPPKKADSSSGRLQFLSTTNKPQNKVKPPVNGTASVPSEAKSAVNGTVPVAKAEQPKPHIVPTKEHEATNHHEPTKEPRERPKEHPESKAAHESLVETPNPGKDQSLFVLCIHCIRMVLIKCIQGTPLAQLSNDKPSFALITTACRSCCLDSEKTQSDEVRISPDLIRYTAMYECARKVAEDEVEVLATKKSVAHISFEKLTSSIGRECQIQGIATSSEILQRLREVARKDVLLGYVPGAFL